MKKSKFTESQIVKILKEVEAGRMVKEVCREYACLMLPIITGKQNTEVWKPLISNGLKSLKMKTVNSSKCMLS